ncbi:MAG: MBG domain-containing protein [Christensenellaceae bacterium]|jgi:hypothetical protein|nr:MBG domain-containing protein [Christensenellaceae bacterium]
MNIRYKFSFCIIFSVLIILCFALVGASNLFKASAFTMPDGLYNAAPSGNTLIGSAPWNNDASYLGNNNEGLQFGTNAMQTRAISGQLSTAQTDLNEGVNRDFRSTGLTRYILTTASIEGTAGQSGASVVSNIKLNTADDNYAAVSYALAIPNYNVKVRFSATIENTGGDPTEYQLFLNFYPYGTNSNDGKSSNQDKITVIGNSSGQFAGTNEFKVPTFIGDLSNAILEIIFYAPAGALFKMTSPSVKVSLDIDEDLTKLNIVSSSTIEVSGLNRSTRTIIAGGSSLDLNTFYLKAGDHIAFTTNVYTMGSSTNRYKFPEKYPYIFGLQNLEGTQRFIGKYDNGQYIYTNPACIVYESSGIDLTKVTEEQLVDASNPSQVSYRTEFIVGQNVLNALYFNIRPKVITGIDLDGNYLVKYQRAAGPYKIYLDTGAPGMPTINPSSSFGSAINNGVWFTDRSDPTLDMVNTNLQVVTDEYTYAILLPSYITSLDMTQLDFTSLNAEFDDGTNVKNQSVTVSGGTAMAEIQRIFKYDSARQNTPSTSKPLVFSHSGEYSLFLITVDVTGNYSNPRTYTNVRVDAQYHDVALEYSVGGGTITKGKGTVSVLYIVGASQHDANGKLINNAAYYINNAKSYTQDTGAKRGEFITFMFRMDANAYNFYRLESYMNKASDNTQITRPVLTLEGGEYYLFITYIMDDANVEEGCIVECSLLEKAVISVQESSFVYTGSHINMNNYSSILSLTSTGANGAKINDVAASFKYYDLLSASAVVSDSNKVTITLSGTEYVVESQNPLIVVASTYKLDGREYYSAKVSQISPNHYDLRIVCLEPDAVKASVYNAGEYWYRAEITEQIGIPRYFGIAQNFLTINKASPDVNSLSAANLTYGDSLEKILYTSRTIPGVLIDSNSSVTFLDSQTIIKRLYFTASEVYGEYIIRSIEAGTDEYTKPQAGRINITIEFVPFNPLFKLDGSPLNENEVVEYCSLYSFYYNYYNGTTLNDSNGKHALNYAAATYTISLVIDKAMASIEVNEQSLDLTYTGSALEPTFTTNPQGLGYIHLYELKNSNGIYNAKTTALPVVAGEYRVTYYIDDSNYQSEEMISTFIVKKMNIKIAVDNDSLTPCNDNLITSSITDQNVTYSYYMQNSYGRLTVPNPTILDDIEVGGITYRYSYKMMRDWTGESVMSDYSEPATLQITNASMISGVYLIKIIVDALNYTGECSIMLYMAPANANDTLETTNFLYAFPDVLSTYAVYNIGSSIPVSISYDTTIGHVEYGQTIAELIVDNQIFSNLANAGVQYLYLTGRDSVAGRFRLSNEEEIAILNNITLDTRTDSITNEQTKILPVRYDLYTGNTIAYNAFIIWEAGEYNDNGVFIVNNDFKSITKSISLYVARATPTFENIEPFDSVVYETKLSDVVFIGKPHVAGNNGTITGIKGYDLENYEYNITPENGEYIPETGSNTVTFVFTPREDIYLKRYREVAFSIEIIVTQKEGSIEIGENASAQFGDIYTNPPATTLPQGLALKYEYFDASNKPVVVGPATPVGTYTLKVSINEKNYYGEATSTYVIEKATLVWNVQPVTVQGEIRYGVKIKDIALTTGGSLKTREGTYILPGSFVCSSIDDYEIDDYIPTGKHNVYVKYTPSMIIEDGFDNNYIVPDLTISIEILKANPIIIVSDISKTYDGESKGATISFDGLIPSYIVSYTSLYTNKSSGVSLGVNMLPTLAGEYTLLITIDDSHYQGSTSSNFTILKAITTVAPINYVFAYDGASHTFTYSKSVEGLNYSLTYINSTGIEYTQPPSVAGKYTVNIKLNEGYLESNYQISGTGNYSFYIVPVVNGIVDVSKLQQYYGATQPVNVTFTYPPTSIETKYVSVTNDIVLYDHDFNSAPADIYDLHFNIVVNGLTCTVIAGKTSSIDENFYSRVIIPDEGTFNLYDAGNTSYVTDLYVVVRKSPVNIILESRYETTYTASNFDPKTMGIYVELDSYQPKLLFSYIDMDAKNDQTEKDNVAVAGKYKVIVKIDDMNYVGEANTELTIKKATPNANQAPTLAEKYSYSDDPSKVVFKNDGWVLFNGNNIEGLWYVDTTDFDKLPVGQYDNISFRFEPFNTSLNNAYIYGSVNISKKNIKEYLAYESADLVQEYNRDQHSVRAYIRDRSAEFMAADSSLNLIVTYNNNTYAPEQCDDYNIMIYVVSIYYEGSIGGDNTIIMKVKPATPSIILPTFPSLTAGQPLSNVSPTGGLAYIGDTIHTIDGVFYFNDPTQTSTLLNERQFLMTFAPTDSVNYNSPTFPVYVLIVPAEPVEYYYGTAQVEPFVYGQTLSSIQITPKREHDNYIPGTFEWVDSTLMPKNLDVVSYRFIPSKIQIDSDSQKPFYDIYPIVTGTVTVNVNNADFAIEYGAYGIVYVGETLSQVRLYVTPLNSTTNLPINDYNILLQQGNTQIPLNTVITTAYLSTAQPVLTLDVSILLTKSYYNMKSFNITDIRVRNLLNPINFNTSVFTKKYDGIALTGLSLLTTVGLNVTSTSFEHDLSKYTINSIFRDGILVESVLDAGSYVINITYDDGIHYGTTQFQFEVTKRDISNAISLLDGTSTIQFVYGSTKDTFELKFTEVIDNQVFNYDALEILPYISFKYVDTNNSITYGATAPRNAGEYTVDVSISVGCPMYSGSRKFVYIIVRKEIQIYFPSSGYTFQYGDAISIIPVIDVVDAEAYYLTFNSNIGVPENAGSYLVRAHLDGKNFYGTSEPIGLLIEKAKLVVTQLPTVSGLIYGQNLGSAKISGGSCANAKSGKVAEGAFYFMNPDSISFTAGANNRVYLKYIYNDNYEILENIQVDVTVGKATSSISVISQTAVYTGGEVKPLVNSDTAYPVTYEMLFTRDYAVVSPINVGEYTVRITINDDNYQGEISNLIFTITPIEAKDHIPPVTSSISYGASLSVSSFFGGSVIYFDGISTPGTFVYASPALVPGVNEKVIGLGGPGDVGVYKVGYKFIPSDSLNYQEWSGEIHITVTKAIASIIVTNYNFVYGEFITAPTFNTLPGGIIVQNDEFVSSGFEGTTRTAGVYNFRAYIQNEYYTGETVYNIIVAKKAVSFKFVNDANNEVEKYLTEYNVPLSVAIAIDADSVYATDGGTASVIKMLSNNILFTYSEKNVANSTIYFTPPTKVGVYTVSVTISNNNYYIKTEDSQIDYEIERATVKKIEFDANSISNQIYGSVTMPLVTIEPTGVPYELRFDDQPYLPTSVGDHNVVIIISDPNYVPISKQNRFRILPKSITIEDIVVLNKAFDGTANLTITASLKGVIRNDEVYLNIEARTKDSATEVGYHEVQITKWELKGQHAGNYTIAQTPVYESRISITNQKVEDSSGSGYITSNEGFSPNITIDIRDVTSSANPSNVFTVILGQKAIVKAVSLKENGNNLVLGEKVKFYILLPESYRNSKSLEFRQAGNLEGEAVAFTREGDYITFYADRSGEIVILAHDFPYWLIIVGGALLLIVSLFVFIKAMPARRQLYTTRRFRREYQKRAYTTNRIAAIAEKKKIREEESKYNARFD